MQSFNPADVFTLMMDTEIRKAGLAGNYCGIIVELDGIPDSEMIKQKCESFATRFPEATARLQPTSRNHQWRPSPLTPLIPFVLHPDAGQCSEEQSARIISNILNQSALPAEAAPIEVHLVPHGAQCLLILKWFHPACDAKGAELVLHHLFQESSNPAKSHTSALALRLKNWSWWEKAKLAYRAKKNIQQLDKQTSILPYQHAAESDFVHNRVLRFSEEESTEILRLARKNTGLTGTSLYFIGCMMRALENTGEKRSGEAYCVPYATNLRKRKSLYPVFGNEVSFLFSQAGREIIQNRSELFSHLREQNKQAIKSGLDHAMLALMLAGSWLKLEQYGQIVRNTAQGKERSSFWFSFTGSMDPEPATICECKVENVYQFSQVTSPPGLGLLVNQFQGRILLSINYVQNQIEPDWVAMLMENIKAELLEMTRPAHE